MKFWFGWDTWDGRMGRLDTTHCMYFIFHGFTLLLLHLYVYSCYVRVALSSRGTVVSDSQNFKVDLKNGNYTNKSHLTLCDYLARIGYIQDSWRNSKT